jgi:hypothetical protein
VAIPADPRAPRPATASSPVDPVLPSI